MPNQPHDPTKGRPAFNNAAQRHMAAQEVRFTTDPNNDFDIRILSITDRFVDSIETAEKALQDYCKTCDNPLLQPQTHIKSALQALGTAEITAQQLKYYGVNTQKYTAFVEQCHITVHALHAQGLSYQLHLNNTVSNVKNTLNTRDKAMKTALSMYRKTDAPSSGIQTMRDIMQQEERPAVPPALRTYINDYNKNRAAFISRTQPSPPPRP
ncbi:MAG: hypothetical protein OXT65_03705 [Alphaproteobacteria bacterium]|nr:hypothetical protein [Alphaproteobacteria bacterium]